MSESLRAAKERTLFRYQHHQDPDALGKVWDEAIEAVVAKVKSSDGNWYYLDNTSDTYDAITNIKWADWIESEAKK